MHSDILCSSYNCCTNDEITKALTSLHCDLMHRNCFLVVLILYMTLLKIKHMNKHVSFSFFFGILFFLNVWLMFILGFF